MRRHGIEAHHELLRGGLPAGLPGLPGGLGGPGGNAMMQQAELSPACRGQSSVVLLFPFGLEAQQMMMNNPGMMQQAPFRYP